MSAEVVEGLPPDLIPEGDYVAVLVDRRYGSDTWEIQEPGKPWHGRRVFVLPQKITAKIRVAHQRYAKGEETVILAHGRLI